MKNCRDARLGAGGVLLALVMLLTAGCTGPDPAGRPTVAVSVLPQAWFVERLAEERVEVEVMVPPGASPVTYEPTVEQMRAMSRAIVYVKVGHPSFSFEAAWLDDLLAARPGVRVVDGSAGVTVREGDPHVWLSPTAARAMARGLAEALTEALPEAAGEIRARLEALEAEIDAVERDLEARLGPLRGGRFYVFHPAWGYLARDYGLSQVAIEERGREPSPRRLQEILERARADGVEIILVQPQFSRQQVETLAEDLGARLELADPLAGDWATNLREVAALLAEAVVMPVEAVVMPAEAVVMPAESAMALTCWQEGRAMKDLV